jgi:hypothetical protein
MSNINFQPNKKSKTFHSEEKQQTLPDFNISAANQLLKVAAFHMDGALNRFYFKTGIEVTTLRLFSDKPDSRNMFLLKVCKAISMFNSQIGYSHISDDVYEMEIAVFLDTVLICFLQQESLQPPVVAQECVNQIRHECSSPTTTNEDSMSVDSSSCDFEDSVSLEDAELLEFIGADDLFSDW